MINERGIFLPGFYLFSLIILHVIVYCAMLTALCPTYALFSELLASLDLRLTF